MNVTELARKLKIPTKELLEILPAVGFGIGRRAIKIDNRQAQKVIEQWPRLLAQYKTQNTPDEETIKVENIPLPPEQKTIIIPQTIRVKDFAQKLKCSISKVMSELMKNGVLSSMNEEIDFETAAIIGNELGFEIVIDENIYSEKEKTTSEKLESLLSEQDKKKLKVRPPVVVVMGHVDHGKTKLLDTIRETNIIEKESGGITQHIGAYQVEKNGKLITFIDTPGHEAFTTMRSRGARVADIAILVIAADDSIQPQTKESIKIIKSAGLPMVVAINKIDKPDANPEKVKQDLASMNLVPEEWGGKTIVVPISAKQNIGIDELLEIIILITETEKEEIMANPERLAVGTIIESHIDKGQGPVATILIQNGTLRSGDLVEVSGNFYGKIRAMKNFIGKDVKEAPPSTPVKILGLKAAPSVGDVLEAKSDISKKTKIKKYQLTQQSTDYTKPSDSSSEKNGCKSFNIVLKADVLGSLEAIIASLVKMDHPEVRINIVSKGLGNINENDVKSAEASNSIIFGFHVKLTQEAASLAKDKKVEVRLYEIIYKLFEDAKQKLEELLSPDIIRTDLGRIKVLAVFHKENNSMIIGGSVTKGIAKLGAKVDIIRQKTKLATGNITQLQVNKVDVNEAEMGKECGMKYEGKPIIEKDDFLEFYTEEIKEKKI